MIDFILIKSVCFKELKKADTIITKLKFIFCLKPVLETFKHLYTFSVKNLTLQNKNGPQAFPFPPTAQTQGPLPQL